MNSIVVKILVSMLLFVSWACSSMKNIEYSESHSNNKVTVVGDFVNLSSGNNQKIIFNGSNNELVFEYFDTFFNSKNSRDVVIVEGDGNVVHIRHNGAVINSVNSCDTLIIRGDKTYFELVHDFFIDNSDSSGEVIELQEDEIEFVYERNDAYERDTSLVENRFTNEWMPVWRVFDHYLKKAMTGDSKAAFYIGEMYHMGVGSQVDIKKAEYYYKISATQDYLDAQVILGYLYEESFDGIETDKSKAVYWYEKAASSGDAYAIERLQELKNE